MVNFKRLSFKRILSEALNPTMQYSVATSFRDGKGTAFLNLLGLDQQDKSTLVRSFGGRVNPKTNNVFYMTSVNNPGPFAAYFKTAYDYLAKTGRYILPNYDIIKAEIEQTKLDQVTPDERKVSSTKYEDLLEHIIRTLGSPETQDLINKIAQLGIDPNITDKRFGHIISPRNVLRAYSGKPDASYVATRAQWRKFNRLINPTAVKLVLMAPMSGGYNQQKATDALGISRQDASASAHMAHKFDVEAREDTQGFMATAYFDISDTFVIPGEPDRWEDEAGLVDNLRGILNSFAQAQVGSNTLDADKAAELGVQSDETKNKVVFARLFNHIQAKKSLTPAEIQALIGMDPANDKSIVEMLTLYFNRVSFEREHDTAKKNLQTAVAVAGILAIEKVAPLYLASILRRHEEVKKLDRAEVITVFKDILKVHDIISRKTDLGETVITETELHSPDDLLGLFGLSMNDLTDSNPTDTQNDIAEINNTIQTIQENFIKALK